MLQAPVHVFSYQLRSHGLLLGAIYVIFEIGETSDIRCYRL